MVSRVAPRKPGKVREFGIGQGKVREMWFACGVLSSHTINITQLLLSKDDMHKMNLQIVHLGLSVYVVYISDGLIDITVCVRNTWKSWEI